MDRIATKLIVFFLLLLLSTVIVEAAPAVSCEELLKSAEQYDGKIVVYKGEVIGDVMVREEYAWINVSDGTGVLGIFCPRELTQEIKHAGNYKFTGDIVSVKGIFHYSCPEHGGDTDIHAEKITLVQEGAEIPRSLEPGKIKTGIMLVAAAFLLSFVHLLIRRYR